VLVKGWLHFFLGKTPCRSPVSSEIVLELLLREIENLIKKIFPGYFKFWKRNLRRRCIGPIRCSVLVRQVFALIIRNIRRLCFKRESPSSQIVQ
jgi:hypothetical protein